MYKILRSILFFFPAEGVHHFSMKALKILCSWGVTRRLVTWACQPDSKSAAAGDASTAHKASATAAGGHASTVHKPPVTVGDASTVHKAPAGADAGMSMAGKPSTAGEPSTAGNEASGTAPLKRSVLGLDFPNPVGLGAGFDKNALYLRELEALGFGFVEIGTVTPKPQAGNEKPRLFRLPQDQGLINRMGFNNDGVEVIASRLRQWRKKHPGSNASQGSPSPDRTPLIIGGNIGKNKATPNEEAWRDYGICFRALYDYVDYFVVNVSSPNTPGLRELQEKDALRRILVNLQEVRSELTAAGAPWRPLLLKIAPDLSPEQLDHVVALALEISLDGLVATNTTISRTGLLTPADRLESISAGGLSGAPVRERSTEVVRRLAERSAGRIPIIASGGIFTAADAREKLHAGASLVQVWTGFIYEGPFVVNRICRELN
jgi:dihydroorotate dehydrogenase